MSDPKFVGLSKAASILGISHRQLLNWAEQGIIPAYRPSPTGKYLVRLAEVEAAILRRTAQARVQPLTRERVDEIMAASKARLAAARSTQSIKPVKKAPQRYQEQTIH